MLATKVSNHKISDLNAISAKCSLCGDSDTQHVSKHNDFKDTSLYSCTSCAYTFAWPIPSEAKIQAYYSNEYKQSRSSHFGEWYFNFMTRRARSQTNFMTTHQATTPESLKGSKILDYGCGIGAFAACAQSHGAQVTAIDLDNEAIEVGKKLYPNVMFQLGSLNDLQPTDRYDAIALSHVVEHMRDIPSELEQISRRLKPDGVIFIEVPNTTAEQFETSIGHEAHLHFFTLESLTKRLSNMNFEIIHAGTVGPTLADYFAGHDAGHGDYYTNECFEHYHPDTQSQQDGMWIRCLIKPKRQPQSYFLSPRNCLRILKRTPHAIHASKRNHTN